jgi:serine/threonine protein phosphatase PrpC
MKQHKTSSRNRPLRLHVVGKSERGHLLEDNADAFALYNLSEPQQAEQLGKLYLIADGTGNFTTGKSASRIAIETIFAVYYEQCEGDSPLGRLQQAFIAADARIREVAALQQEYKDSTTTCTAVVIRGTRIWIAHIGDSRAYLIRTPSRFQPKITRLTTDHSLVAARVRAGILPAEAMRRSPDERDILLRALGGSEEIHPFPDFVMYDVRPADALVLCSDGLWSVLEENQIAEVVYSLPPQQACEELVRRADEAGGDENMSIVLLSFTEEEEPTGKD